MRLAKMALLSFLAGFAALHAQAAPYPTKQITIVVPYSPGGGGDILARLYAEHLRAAWGQTVIVENRPGGGALIGAAVVAKAPADGYTLLVTAPSITTAKVLFKNPIVNPEKDLVAVSQIVDGPYLIATNVEVPAKNIKEFIRYARENPGKLKYGSIAANNALIVEYFKKRAGVDLLHIPYTGSVPVNTALLRGDVDVIFDGLITLQPTLDTGKARLLAVASANRSPLFPEIPGMAESGVSDFDIGFWFGLMAPKGTPEEVKDKLVSEMKVFLQKPDTKEKLKTFGYIGVGSSSSDFQKLLDREYKLWAEVGTASGIETR